MTTQLNPNLTRIADRLFGREDNPAVEDGANSGCDLPDDQYLEPAQVMRDRDAELERWLEFRARCRAELHVQTPGKPGQIVCVDDLVHPDLQSGAARLPSPLFILLDQPVFMPADASSAPDYLYMSRIWTGWIVTQDTDYATEWDLVLRDSDLREPGCQLVQTWNPVQLYLPSVSRVSGGVTEQTLSQVRRLWSFYAAGEVISEIAPSPGALVLRTIGQDQVVTGTPLIAGSAGQGAGPDPRAQYCAMYSEFAELVSEAVSSMLRDRAAANVVADQTPDSARTHSLGNWAHRRLAEIGASYLPRILAARADHRIASQLPKPSQGVLIRWWQGEIEFRIQPVQATGGTIFLLNSDSPKELALAEFLLWHDKRFALEQQGGSVVISGLSEFAARGYVYLTQDGNEDTIPCVLSTTAGSKTK